MPIFSAKRSYRPKAMIAGLVWLLVCSAAAGALALAGNAHVAPYLAGAGGLGYFVSTIVTMIPQSVTLTVTGGEVVSSWRPAERGTPVLASWVVSGLDAPMGLVLRVGRLRIGGDGLDGAGYPVIGPPSRTVDCHVSATDFEAICAAIGIRKGEPGPVVVPLVRSSQSAGGLVRTMAPWLLTMVAVSVLGVVAGQFDLMMSPRGQVVIMIATVMLVVVGIAVMVIRARRVRAPELELRVTSTALVLATFGGEPISQTPWSAVRTERRRFTQTSRAGSYTMPMLVLTVEGHEPLRLGAWDTRLAWAGEVEKAWRSPRWLVGSALWPQLIDELRRHHCL